MKMNILKKVLTSSLFLFLFVSFCDLAYADRAKIFGNYSYQYGDNESLVAAKKISYTLALRNSIETYKAFIFSTSHVEDFELKKDIIDTIASGYVHDIQIIKQNVENRTVSTTLTGWVNPDKINKIIAQKVTDKVSKDVTTDGRKKDWYVIGFLWALLVGMLCGLTIWWKKGKNFDDNMDVIVIGGIVAALIAGIMFALIIMILN